MSVYEIGYGHHERVCLYSYVELQKLTDTCMTFLSFSESERKTAKFESSVAEKIVAYSFEHMFDTETIHRIPLRINELTGLVYCSQQIISKCYHVSDWSEKAKHVKDYLNSIIIGNNDNVFDRKAEKPLRAKMRKI